MQNTISSFYANIDNMTEDELIAYLSFHGENILDHSEALTPKNISLIAKNLPFSYPYIKKIVENPELKLAYWDNEAFEKEEVEDLEIAHVLVRHGLLKDHDIPVPTLRNLLDQNLDEDLVDLYFELIKKTGPETIVSTGYKTSGNLFQKYLDHISNTKEGVAYLLRRYELAKSIPEDKLFKHYKEMIDNDDFNLDCSALSEDSFLRFMSTINGLDKIKVAIGVLKGSIGVNRGLADSEDFALQLCDIIPDEYLVDVIEEMRENHYLELMISFAKNNRALIVPESRLQTAPWIITKDSDLGLICSVLNELEIDKESFESALQRVADLTPFIKDVLTNYKDFIEQNQIYFSSMENYGIIDFSTYDTDKIEDFVSSSDLTDKLIENLSIYELRKLINRQDVSEKTFTSLANRFIESGYESNLKVVVPNLINKHQEIIFSLLPFTAQSEMFSLFDKLSLETTNSFLQKWLNEGEMTSLSTTQIKNLMQVVDFKTLPTNTLSRIAKSYITKDAEEETVQYLLGLLEKDELELSNVLKVCRNTMLKNEFYTEELFQKSFESLMNLNYSFISFEILSSDKYFNMLNNAQKGLLYEAFENLTEPELVDRAAEVIRNSSKKDLLEVYCSDALLLMFSERNMVFENQEFKSLDRLEGPLLKYGMLYKKELSFEDLGGAHYSPENVEILWPILKPMIENNREEFLSEGLLLVNLLKSSDVEKNRAAFKYIENFATAELIEVANEARKSSPGLIKAIIKKYNVEPFDNEVRSHLKLALKLNVTDFEELVQLIEGDDLMDAVYQIAQHVDQNERKFVRYLRRYDKLKFVPESYLNLLDLLTPGKGWEFYTSKCDSRDLQKMNSSQKATFFNNLEESFSDSVAQFNEDFLTTHVFSNKLLQTIYNNSSYRVLRKFVETGISEESLNKEAIVEIIKADISKLNNMEENIYFSSIYSDLYKSGIKNVFSINNKIDLSDSDIVEILKETKDSDLMSRYQKEWKSLSGVKYDEEIIKELIKTVSQEDITKENIVFEKNVLTFEIGGILLVKAVFSKKQNKWSFSSGYRKDLYAKVKSFYTKLDSEVPEKITGYVSLATGEFEAKEGEVDVGISQEDQDKITYMRELGAEGVIKATAKRMQDFTYRLDVHFDKETSIGTREIEQEIKKKTFDIYKKLDSLLKINPKRTFGFELELGVRGADRSEIAASFKKKGYKVNVSGSYGKSSGKVWDFKEDGSLDSSLFDEDGYDEDEDGETRESNNDVFEIASPILQGKEGITEARKFLTHLFGYDVVSGQDLNAGLHVHHDINDIHELEQSNDEILKSYLPFQETLYNLIEDWRNDSEYCSKIDPAERIQGRGVSDHGGGASGIIFTSYGTMEFRMKEGLENTKEIMNWIIYTQNIVDAIYYKLTNKIEKNKAKMERLSESSVYMLLESMGHRNAGKSKIKEIRKLVGLQEKFYA